MSISHATAVPSAIKSSVSDWLILDSDDVESALPDPHDVFVDWADAFELEPPF